MEVDQGYEIYAESEETTDYMRDITAWAGNIDLVFGRCQTEIREGGL